MKIDNKDIDTLLKRTLSIEEKPENELVENVKKKLYEEETIMKKSPISYSLVAVVAVMALLLVTTTTYAAWLYLKPSEVADKFEDEALSAAFNSETAVNINESVISGDYIFTLLAIVSGNDITDMPYYTDEVQNERTYAVLAIQKADGTSMPAPTDSEYGQTVFFASPLVKGLKPWQVNAATMNGGYSETVEDGIMYRIVECDGVTMFADRGLYFAVSTSSFYDINAFTYDEQTGEITANPDYEGASAIFELPIDEKLADPQKAEDYLDSLDQISDDKVTGDNDDEWDDIDWEKAIPIDSTAKELIPDEDGVVNYIYDFEYGSGNITFVLDEYIESNQMPQSIIIQQMKSDDVEYAFRISIDETGTITGAIVMP